MARFQDRTIDAFKTKLKGGGARSNLFEVTFDSNNSGASGGVPSGRFFQEIGISFDHVHFSALIKRKLNCYANR